MLAPDPVPTPPYPISLPDEFADEAYEDLPPIWQRRIYRAIRFPQFAKMARPSG